MSPWDVWIGLAVLAVCGAVAVGAGAAWTVWVIGGRR